MKNSFMEIPVLFENNHFLVVDKPAGTLSVPSRMGEADSRPCVGKILEKQKAIRLWPIHRLDLEVSGILLFAKDAEAHRLASRWFGDREVTKVYEAFTEGQTSPREQEEFNWESLLLRGKKRAYEKPFGKKSITRARYLGYKKFHHWLVFPLTGRPHQIRYELAKHGFPIVGDELYGAKTKCCEHEILLRAVELDLSKIPNNSRLGLPSNLRASPLHLSE